MSRMLLPVCLAVSLAGFAGCQPGPNELQPPIGELHPENRGVQAKNITEMSEKMASSIVQAQVVTQDLEKYKTKITIVMKPMVVPDSGQDMTVAVARMRVLLNKYARDRLAFVEEARTLSRLQSEELGGIQPGQIPTNRLLPQYVLKGEIRPLRNYGTSYYLFTFQLTRLLPGAGSGEIVWEDMYEVNTKN